MLPFDVKLSELENIKLKEAADPSSFSILFCPTLAYSAINY
jgi:hypothetical protein